MSEAIQHFGLDAWIVPAPFSACLGVFLLLGTDWLGYILLKKFGLIGANSLTAFRMQAIPIGAMILAVILYPLAMMRALPLILMQCLGWSLFLLGIFNAQGLYKQCLLVCSTWREHGRLISSIGFDVMLSLGIITLLFLIALGPVTNADALDYHMGVAIEILNREGIVFLPEWFTSTLAGNGEVINALGLAIGSEQFGSLLQWGSLISITALVWPITSELKEPKFVGGNLVLLAVLSSPVILFLISGPKPQLWPVAMTSLAFYLFMVPSIGKVPIEKLRLRFLLACMLCMCAMQAKFNYILGGGIAGCLAFSVMIWRREALFAVLISILSASLIILPPVIWKLLVFDVSLLDIFIKPLPAQLPGNEIAMEIFSKNPDFISSFFFPLSIIIPSSFGEISAVLGLGWILVILYRPGIETLHRVGFAVLILFLIVNVLLAPPSARSYLEPYFWGLILCSLAVREGRLLFPGYFAFIVRSQAFIFLVLCGYGVSILTPGAFSASLREQAMYKFANGYDLMRWVDQTLPKDAILLNNHRSMALAPRKAFNNFYWTKYVDSSSSEASFYLSRIKDVRPTHILVLGEFSDDSPMSGCYGKTYAGPKKSHMAARNPFNTGSTFNAWLLEFNYELLPECAQPSYSSN